MKKFLLIVLILLIIAAAVLGFAFYNANSLIARFKPYLESTISGLIGAEITLGSVEASILPQTALKVSGLKIKDSNEVGPAFSEFILQTELAPLLQRKLVITKVVLKDPQFTIVKDQNGVRLKGLPVGQKKKEQPQSTASPASTSNQDTGSKGSLPLEIQLKSFELANGTLNFEDVQAQKSYQIKNLEISNDLILSGSEVNIKDLQLTAKALEKYALNFKAPSVQVSKNELSVPAFAAALESLAVDGALSFNPNAKSGKATVKSNGVDLGKLAVLASDFAPAITALGLSGTAVPDLAINIKDGGASIDASGKIGLSGIYAKQGNFAVSNLAGQLDLRAQGPKDAMVSTENLSLALNGQNVALKFAAKLLDQQLNVENLQAQLLGGSASGALGLALAEKTFSANLKGGGFDIDKALALIQSGQGKISGAITSFAANVNGRLGPDLKQSLRGTVNAQLENGQLKGFNLAGIVLKAINNLPFLTGALYSSVPTSERGALDASDTAFSSLNAALAFEGNGIRARSVKMVAPVFSLEADGTVGFDSNLDLASTIFFNAAFSKNLVAVVPGLRAILKEGGLLVIPLRIQGVPPLVLVYPNMKSLIELAGKNIIKEKAGEAVKGLLEKQGLGGVEKLFGF